MTGSTDFQFVTAAYLTRISNLTANTLNELFTCLDQASDTSIFRHTFQSLSRHHFLTAGFSNDFAQWVLASLNRPLLAERLGGLDIRDYVSLAELRGDLRRIVGDYCAGHAREAEMTAFEPFHFCEAMEVTVPFTTARTLSDFRDALRHLSHESFYYHFISSRLRLQLKTNDFSNWLGSTQGLDEVARKVNRIDVYTNTLDTARQELIELIDREILQ